MEPMYEAVNCKLRVYLIYRQEMDFVAMLLLWRLNANEYIANVLCKSNIIKYVVILYI